MHLCKVLARVNFGHAVSRVREDVERAMKLELLDVNPSLGEFENRQGLALIGTGASRLACAHCIFDIMLFDRSHDDISWFTVLSAN